MFTKKFGIEVEFTGITRKKAAETAARYLNATVTLEDDYYDTPPGDSSGREGLEIYVRRQPGLPAAGRGRVSPQQQAQRGNGQPGFTVP